MKVKITKLQELEDAVHPNNIPENYTKVVNVNPLYFKKPILNERFTLGFFSTSEVQEIINDNTFKTYNSIYQWEIIED